VTARRALLALLLPAVAACERAPAPEAGAPPRAEARAPAPPPAPARDTALEAAFREAAAEIEGVVGVYALHLEGNVEAALEADRPFPLASVYKLPVAYAALRRPEVGPLDSAAVLPADRAPGETPFNGGETTVPVARLVERAVAHSDNTASDVLLRLAGGPEAVTREVRTLGIRDLRVDRSLRRIFAEWRGILDLAGLEGWTPAELDRRSAAVPAGVRDEAQAAFLEDVRDTGTPRAVGELLAAVHRGRGLEAGDAQLLREALQATVTGPARIRAGVPEEARVGNKTGTLGPLTHDVGIVTLPGEGGHLVLAVLVRSEAPLAARERTIAAIARAAWERFAGAEGGAAGAGP
jgi:beta-lactamase class A